jgi:hypothetical protein
MIFKLEINQLSKIITNGQKGSWKSSWAESRKWHRLIAEALILNKVQLNEPLTKAHLRLTRHSSVEPDFDGLVSSFKHVIDGLVRAGILTNDKISNIGQPEYFWQKAKPNNGKIIIEVFRAQTK